MSSPPGQTWELYVFDHVRLFQLLGRSLASPMAFVLIGDSPVKRKTSYKKPPNVQPKKGATMGTYTPR